MAEPHYNLSEDVRHMWATACARAGLDVLDKTLLLESYAQVRVRVAEVMVTNRWAPDTTTALAEIPFPTDDDMTWVATTVITGQLRVLMSGEDPHMACWTGNHNICPGVHPKDRVVPNSARWRCDCACHQEAPRG